jgi:hypothetical protein
MPELIAYATDLVKAATMPIVPAPSKRDWIERLPERFGNRCLPMLLANSSGWWILNNRKFSVVWDGGPRMEDLRITYEPMERPPPQCVFTHFGAGIVTIPVPWRFKTPAGYDLLARGPANMPKDGIQALEGLIETDWSAVTFTMNWQLTRPSQRVWFEQGEPICMVVPQKRGELESFEPKWMPDTMDKEGSERRLAFEQSRVKFLQEKNNPKSDAARMKWQRHYFLGTEEGKPTGWRFKEHQSKVVLKEFEPVLPNVDSEEKK